MIISSKIHNDWHDEAIPQMQAQWKGYRVSEYPIQLSVIFYWKDLRRHDLDNGLATILDALKDAGVIEDDDFLHVNAVTVMYGELDRKNPRCEISFNE